MSTFQQNPLNSLSPILLSPSTTTITNHISLFDNSDQGSVDSDYTSLGSSKFYAHSGSTSSLNRQGRSQSIDELASSITTTIPTRHFNGLLNVNKSNNDPLQFVKIHPNHDLIERAQEQLSLAESRKRLQENYEITNKSNANKVNDEENDWSKNFSTSTAMPAGRMNNNALTSSSHIRQSEVFEDYSQAVDNWRKKREQKRLKNVKSTDHSDDDQPIITLKAEPISKLQETKKTINEPVAKPTRMLLPPPPVPVKSKSPSPQRIKGPAKIREIFIEKPIDVRGFGFKLEGGRVQNRPIYISTIEEGSPADKAGLYIDDEIVSMNDENIESMSFDQVRKILKERNLRGSIKLVVRTFEDVADDQSQTITTGPTTDHSRTPSPQKITSPLTLPSYSVATPKIKSSIPSPVSSYIQFNPISSSDTTKVSPLQQIPTSSLNIFTPKPFRSTNSTNTNESSIYDKELQDLEAEFEKQLRGIDETPIRETTINSDKQETNVPKPPTRVVVNTPQTLVDQSPPVPPIDSFVHRAPNTDNTGKQQRNDTPIAQVRSYVEKQMDQLQQELEFGFPRSTKVPSLTSLVPAPAREQEPVTIPIDLTSASLSPPPAPIPSEFLRSSLKKSSSTQNHLDRIPSNRTYGLKIDPNEQVIHYLDPYAQQNYTKHSIPDLPSMRTHTFNDLKATTPESYSTQIINQQQQQQQKKVTIQLGGRIPQQRITNKQLHSALNQTPRKTHFHDQILINDESRKQTNVKTSGRRSAPLAPPRQELQMFNYQGQQRSSNVSPNRQSRTKSPARTMMESNNDRVLSVSGKLRCSRCTDELGQGSAMVIESLGLYYHIECFRCCVCNIPLASSFEGTDVRVRNNRLHCQNCFSDDNGVKLSAV
ncbi:unnamed protein product [Rotaria socialis]|uniref:Uncharacterized protein n=1 Tax=Rotaria socialis TaxID=392032 RepID=A0A818TYL6_9BILA|nr:unnamed protein product [Rotaria socialis]CAF3690599.1 unnamed protein product [Rotaria socialis]CAF4665977.1 unnamed protein product [Rotaria socialis]